MLVILRGAGLDPQKDVNIISVGDAGLRMDQLRLGVIDATVLTAPHCFVAERAGFKSLGSSKDAVPLPAIGIVTLERKITRETGAGKESTPDSFEEPEISARES